MPILLELFNAEVVALHQIEIATGQAFVRVHPQSVTDVTAALAAHLTDHPAVEHYRTRTDEMGPLELAVAVQASLVAVYGAAEVDLSVDEEREAGRDRTGLTARELQLLAFVASGMTAQAIGHAERISPRTVRKHLQHVYAKLGRVPAWPELDKALLVARARAEESSTCRTGARPGGELKNLPSCLACWWVCSSPPCGLRPLDPEEEKCVHPCSPELRRSRRLPRLPRSR